MKKKILIVDDLTFDILLLRSVIENCKHFDEIDTACDGAEALTQLSQNRYDLIFLDIKMPKVNGLDLLKLLQEQKQTHLPPVFVLSSSKSQEDRKHAIALGAVEYVHKSIDYSEFRSNLRETLERYGFC